MEDLQKMYSRSLREGSKQASTFAVSISFIAITSFVMALRFHVRFNLIQGGLGLDDRECKAALTLCSGSLLCFII